MYESFDRGANWQFKANLPTLQFYDVRRGKRDAVLPCLRRHADNWSLGGPSRTRSASGITNTDCMSLPAATGFIRASIRRIPTPSIASRNMADLCDMTGAPGSAWGSNHGG